MRDGATGLGLACLAPRASTDAACTLPAPAVGSESGVGVATLTPPVVIPSERSESTDPHLVVIPSERSESRDLPLWFLTESAEGAEAVLCVLCALCEKQREKRSRPFRGVAVQDQRSVVGKPRAESHPARPLLVTLRVLAEPEMIS